MQRDFIIRPAEKTDRPSIRAIIYKTRINPLNLDWQNFLVAEDKPGRIIGCGQIKTHRDGTSELASIAVKEGWRRRGIASEIIRTLIESIESPLWLVCRADIASFYTQFGFEKMDDLNELPKSFRRMRRIAGLFTRIPSIGRFAIMVLDTNSKPS